MFETLRWRALHDIWQVFTLFKQRLLQIRDTTFLTILQQKPHRTAMRRGRLLARIAVAQRRNPNKTAIHCASERHIQQA
ncbi:Uncharacterised protein [Vibrio cholerae]|nr:Uncharacterised protein [Vibrio cholerae]CSC08027.1 Uncharacterised protein [Vibrio cholerae]